MASTEESAGVGACVVFALGTICGATADIRLHPTVVMSIADTHTRSLLQFNKSKSIGALFGTQKGREVRVRFDSFRVAFICCRSGFRYDRNLLRS